MRFNDTLFGQDIIKSISFNEGEIIKNIHELHCPNWFELDPCYSIGSFYDRYGIPKPLHKFDLEPQLNCVKQSNANDLPLPDDSVGSIMFDPPFLSTSGPAYDNPLNGQNIMTSRFSAFQTIKELLEWYRTCLIEFNRILKPKGIVVFKNQDTVSGGLQYFSHCQIYNMAIELGFYPKDLFILLAKHRIIGGNHETQYHARKFHCYYWVLIKTELK